MLGHHIGDIDPVCYRLAVVVTAIPDETIESRRTAFWVTGRHLSGPNAFPCDGIDIDRHIRVFGQLVFDIGGFLVGVEGIRTIDQAMEFEIHFHPKHRTADTGFQATVIPCGHNRNIGFPANKVSFQCKFRRDERGRYRTQHIRRTHHHGVSYRIDDTHVVRGDVAIGARCEGGFEGRPDSHIVVFFDGFVIEGEGGDGGRRGCLQFGTGEGGFAATRSEGAAARDNGDVEDFATGGVFDHEVFSRGVCGTKCHKQDHSKRLDPCGGPPPTPSPEGGSFSLRTRACGTRPQTPGIERVSDTVANPFKNKIIPLLGGLGVGAPHRETRFSNASIRVSKALFCFSNAIT